VLPRSVSLLDEGDVVFLTSDGVADNFDPFLLKLARQACGAGGSYLPPTFVPPSTHLVPTLYPPSTHLPPTSPPGADVWTGGGLDGEGGGGGQPPVMSAEEAHARQLEMLADAVSWKLPRSCLEGAWKLPRSCLEELARQLEMLADAVRVRTARWC
jgi:hypothetical protein